MIKKAVLLFITIVFIALNWWNSDYSYLKAIISQNHLETPNDVYHYITENTPSTREKKTEACLYCSPQYLMDEDLALSCDEGAILIAHLSYLLGYETRLVDIIDQSGIARHTMVEVFQNDTWQRYDYLFEKKNPAYTEDLDINFSHAQYRSFPNWYNKIIYNFYGLKFIVVKMRGARG